MATPSRRRRRVRLYRRVANWLLRHQGSPYAVAMGFAVGMFVALTPTVGVQMIIGASVAHLLRANRALPVALAWITNPVTMGPIFYFNYRVGLVFMAGDEQAGRRFIDAIGQATLSEPASIWRAFVLMMAEMWGAAGVLWVGSLVVASAAALISYPIVRRIVVAERHKLVELAGMPSVRPEPSAKPQRVEA